MLYLFTFCVDIGTNSREDLLKVLKILIKSLKVYKNIFELHIFTNFEINIEDKSVKIEKYFNNTKGEFSCKWRDLNFNRINIYKYLYEKYNINFTWIDLDTIIVSNINYLDNLDNFFIEMGGNVNKLTGSYFVNNNNYKIKTKDHIQGNFWKLNNNLYEKLMKCYQELKEKNLKLDYDIQALFNYYIHFKIKNKLKENNINILGKNFNENIMYGEGIWNKRLYTHATYEGMKRLYWENGEMKSMFYKEKKIHLISFTFYKLMKLIDNKKFKMLFKKFI